MASGRIVGTVTRGTTNTNRLRRVDRWIATLPILRRTSSPLVVDLGYGASAVTTFELYRRLAPVRPDVEVIGIEIDPGRVATARAQLDTERAGGGTFEPGMHVDFVRGGFEIPLAGSRRPVVVRAFNVLRQYDERDVVPAWRESLARLQPGGVLVDGTCDEIGRISSWIDVGADGPKELTLSLRLRDLERPSVVAERLPKILIHRNVEDERIHALMTSLDRQWAHNAPLAAYSPSQRWIATARALKLDGWPISGGLSRWRLGELSIAWPAVQPANWRW